MSFAEKVEAIKSDILGKEYSLSFAFVDENQSHEINKKYRQKDRPTNVLSFSLSKNSGEILLCKSVAKREVKEKNSLGKNFNEWLLFLVIHGMLHLKGMDHGGTMEKAEKFYYTKYDQEYKSRNRRRIRNDKSRSGRIPERRKKS